MRPFQFINKLSSLITLMSVIVTLNSFIPSYASSSDMFESNELNKKGTKRQRESGSDSPQLNIKKQKIDIKDEAESVVGNSSPINEIPNLELNLNSLKPASQDTFYIFNVGQGNSQLAVYTENLKEPFGVLYDCGSSAQLMHAKIFQTRSHREFKSILTKKLNNNREVEQLETLENNKNVTSFTADIVLPNNNLSDKAINDENKEDNGTIPEINETNLSFESLSDYSEGSSQGKISYDENKVNLKDVTKIISETIEEHRIKYLFVFLSHPDKDHFNLIPSAIPEGIKTLFILSGDFLQESDSGNGELKQDIQELFKFFKKRDNTEFCLPYFWNFSKYTDIKKSIRNYNDENHVKLLKLSIQSRERITEVPTSLYGSFLDLLAFIKVQDEDTIFPYIDNLSKDPNAKEVLKNIYIWSLNKFSNEINNQSAVVSFKMPSLKKSFICTGDAHEDVFVDIYQLMRNQEIYEEDNRHHLSVSLHNVNEKYTVLLVLPHHGSIENKSLRMLDLFKPEVLAISAGAGMHGHPSNDLVKNYKTYNTKIWEKYKSTGRKYHFLAFEERGKKAFYKEMKDSYCPILCTNILGTLKITRDSFETEYNDQIVYNNNSYITDLSQAIQVNIKDYTPCQDLPHIYVNKNDNIKNPNSILIAVEKKSNNKKGLKYYKADKDENNDNKKS